MTGNVNAVSGIDDAFTRDLEQPQLAGDMALDDKVSAIGGEADALGDALKRTMLMRSLYDAPPIQIDDLRIEATVPPPGDSTVRRVRLADGTGQVYDKDSFRMQKYLYTTMRRNDAHLERNRSWATGCTEYRRPS